MVDGTAATVDAVGTQEARCVLGTWATVVAQAIGGMDARIKATKVAPERGAALVKIILCLWRW